MKILIIEDEFNLADAIPYPKGKPMYLVEDVDNVETLKDIILDTCDGLKEN